MSESPPTPRENPLLIGHDEAERQMLDALRGGRMHHAWLITGPEGVGKATLAYRFARRLLAGTPGPSETLALDPADPVFRRVAAGTHADLLTVEREWDEKKKRMRKAIAAEDVRAIPDFLHLTPAEGGWRVVVVDGAEDLNIHSANALLKVLEEPPPRAMLLLACSAPGRLPATIRSRCRQLRLSALTPADMARLLALYLPETGMAERERLAALAEGAPGRALTLAAGDGLALAALVGEVVDALPDMPPLRGYAVADKLGRGEDAFETFMTLLRGAIASAVRAVLRGEADARQARLVSLRPLDAWGDVWHALTRLQDETERFNLDKKQAVLSGLALLSGR